MLWLRRKPVEVNIRIVALDDGSATTLTRTPRLIELTPTNAANWLQKISVEIEPDFLAVHVQTGDTAKPHSKTLFVHPDGSATFEC